MQQHVAIELDTDASRYCKRLHLRGMFKFFAARRVSADKLLRRCTEVPAIPSSYYLIRQAAFRSPLFGRDQVRAASDFNRLGNLLDMYYEYGATKKHDKIYALLGMSAGLNGVIKPDYTLPWHHLFHKIIDHILATDVRVRTWPQREISVICGPSFVLGTATPFKIGMPDGSRNNVMFKDPIGRNYTVEMVIVSFLELIAMKASSCVLNA